VPEVEAVLFDYGGVLATSQWEAFAEFERARGFEPGALAARFGIEHPSRPGTPAWQLIETGELAWADYADAVGVEGIHDVAALMPLRALWPMVAVVRRLRADGYRLGILTNNVREFGEYWRSTIPVDLFDVVVDSCEVGLRKPDEAIYRLAAERIGVPPARCAFLDDSPVNVAAAEATGMRGVVVGADLDEAIAALDGILAG
jgi:putative hydrolase of the HAD superfamily